MGPSKCTGGLPSHFLKNAIEGRFRVEARVVKNGEYGIVLTSWRNEQLPGIVYPQPIDVVCEGYPKVRIQHVRDVSLRYTQPRREIGNREGRIQEFVMRLHVATELGGYDRSLFGRKEVSGYWPRIVKRQRPDSRNRSAAGENQEEQDRNKLE